MPHSGTASARTFHVSPGSPHPLGATLEGDGSVNFAVNAPQASAVELCLFLDPDHPSKETVRLPVATRSGDTWHLRVGNLPAGSTYGFRVDGPWDRLAGMLFNPHKLLLDPYARRLAGPTRHHPSLRTRDESGDRERTDSAAHAPRAFIPTPDLYDWEDDTHPFTPMTETVVCEMHVKGFSKLNPAVPEELRGTYAGLGHPASTGYLRDLGITAVQLMPVHQHLDDGFLLERGLVNYWGYNTLAFFAPECRYAASSDPVTEFRDMVKALHRAQIEVILDVVYNHTCEAGPDGPTCHLRGFDNRSYYHTDPARPGQYLDFTGCGNSVDISHPRSLRLVMDSLRYWVEEMHVDGFRFDLAVELGRDSQGYSRRATFFQAVHQDPVLSRVKMIAEPWDLGYGGYQIGNFPIDWAELNGKYRDTVRRFWRGDPGVSGEFAARITGSEDLFAHNRRTPAASVNMITSHDGFTLRDLVSYNHKHNFANGEKNADGDSHNISFNHGVEGETNDPGILALRQRQVRNFLATLFCSQGVPFLLAGDEKLRTQGGNNNSYCQDSELSWLSWEETPEASALRGFVKRLLALRREFPILRRTSFFDGQPLKENGLPDICWLRPDGKTKESVDWEAEKPGSFAVLVNGGGSCDSLLFFFNARHETREFHFPRQPRCSWTLVADTADSTHEGVEAATPAFVSVMQRSMQIWRQGPPLPPRVRTSRPSVRTRSTRRETPSTRIRRARRRLQRNAPRGLPGGAGRARPTSAK
ncbi:MAG: glycogen debranching protein GlgX [Verrucomicrobiae bacterium]|nr:glycogen debranching protein GlgX [Verrucomicrobiae bacterium]